MTLQGEQESLCVQPPDTVRYHRRSVKVLARVAVQDQQPRPRKPGRFAYRVRREAGIVIGRPIAGLVWIGSPGIFYTT